MLLVGACGGGAVPTRSTAPSSAAPSTIGPIAPTPAGTPVVPPTDGGAPTASPAPGATDSDPGGAILPTDAALFGTGLVPDGWQIVEDVTGACRIAVPAEWTTDVVPGVGQTSALAEGLAGVSADTQEWDALKQAIDQFYLSGHVVLIDTEDVFLISNPIGADLDLSYVLALRFDDVNCQLLTTVQRNWIAQYAAPAILVAQTLDHTD